MPTNLLTCAMYYWLILSGSANGYAYTFTLCNAYSIREDTEIIMEKGILIINMPKI